MNRPPRKAPPTEAATGKTPAKRKKPGQAWRAFKGLFFTVFLIGLLGFGIVAGYVYKVVRETEPITKFNIGELLDENSVIVDQNGTVIENIQVDGLRKLVKYKDINPMLVDAYIAVEDKTFREHHGFNFVRFAGAILEGVTEGRGVRGTSTITQQLARNLYLSDIKSQRSMSRKIKEAYYAIQLENAMTKDQIMEAYLNTIYLGSGNKGIQAAAQTYFSKNASDLGLVESAILAGIPKSPLKYSPFLTVEKSKVKETDYIIDDSSPTYTTIFNESCVTRYKTVAKLIYDNGYITQEQYDSIKDADLKTYLVPGKVKTADISSYFSDLLKDEVIRILVQEKGLTEERAANMLYGGGLKIYSTIDLDIQKKLEAAYAPEPFSNKFDDPMKRAVVTFQKNNKLEASGSIGPETLEALKLKGLLDPSDLEGQQFKPGATGEDIVKLKEALERDGLLFKRNPKMPSILAYKDAQNNIVALSRTNRKTVINSEILLNSYDTAINTDGQLVIGKDNYFFDANGDLVLYSDRMFSFYRSYDKNKTVNDIMVVLKDCYKSDTTQEKVIGGGGAFYTKKVNIPELFIYKGGALKIPYEFKQFDDDKNMIISKAFLQANPEMFKADGNGNLIVPKESYTISNTGIIQPQSATVIMDYRTGQIKAIVGGRNVTGQKIYNRALHPRQPGSSIKPIGVYLPAIDKGYTAASVFDDVPRYQGGQRWPINWYDSGAFKYWGLMTIREAIEWSNNVVAVKCAEAVGVENCIPYLEKMGITSIDKEGAVSDVNLAAIALGGMTQGISPLELTGAYSSVANKGVYIKPTSFTKIEDSQGNLVFEHTPFQQKVVSEEVAFVVQDMMRSGATGGLASTAAISPGNTGIPVAGKTGTTSNKFDAWFAGFTPYYAAAVWIGNDVQMELSDGSKISALFWKDVMKTVHSGLPPKDFEVPSGMVRAAVDKTSGKLPSSLSSSDPRGSMVISEWFVPGSVPTEVDDIHVTAEICTVSGKLATEFCPQSLVETRVFIRRKDEYQPGSTLEAGKSIPVRDYQYQVPSASCDIHNAENRGGSGMGLFSGIAAEPSADGGKTLLETVTAILVDNSVWQLPVGTVVSADGTVRLPEGNILQLDMIRQVYPAGQAPPATEAPMNP